MAIKTLRDIKNYSNIKTHGSLAREGKLVSVARDLHNGSGFGGGIGSAESKGNMGDWSSHVYNKEKEIRKGKPAKRFSSPITPFQDPNFDGKIKSRQIEELQNSLAELEQAASEGFSVSADELSRLKARLAELQAK